MTVAKPISVFLTSSSGMLSAVWALFETPKAAVSEPASQRPQFSIGSNPLVVDRSRHARLLEHELDRQHLTAVEREDSAMLDRVRLALYAD